MSTANKMLSVTQRIFSNWTALKLIFESDMGSRDDLLAFSEYIAEVLCMNDELIASDIEYELEDYIASKFNTEIDDGSYTQIAEELLRFYNYIKRNEEAAFLQEVEKLSPAQLWLITPQPAPKQYIIEDSSDEESSTNQSNESMEVDGWVTVKSKRKSNK